MIEIKNLDGVVIHTVDADTLAWAAGRRCHFDGSNMEAVNRLRQMMRLPLLVVVS